jgi:hypothetical protein
MAAGTTPAAAAPTTAAATMATAASTRDLHGGTKILPIEEIERGETDVGHFLFAKDEALVGRVVVGLREIGSGHGGCGCVTRQRKPQSGGTQRRHGGGFGCAFPLRSLLDLWHARILRPFAVKPVQPDVASVRPAKPARKGYLCARMQKDRAGFPFIFMTRARRAASVARSGAVRK